MPHLVRVMLTYALVMVVVLAAIVLVAAGRPALGVAFAVSAVLLADARPVRYLGKIRRRRGRGPGLNS
jgi:hypothetical protein